MNLNTAHSIEMSTSFLSMLSNGAVRINFELNLDMLMCTNLSNPGFQTFKWWISRNPED